MKLFQLNIKTILFLILLISTQSIIAQRNKVPIEVQTKVIPKILSLNKNILSTSKSPLNVMIIYSKDQRNSKNIYDNLKNHINNEVNKSNFHNTKFHSFDIKILKDFRKYIRVNDIRVLYITPIRGVDISSITRICREEDVLTITGVEEFKGNDVSVILGLEKSKLKIMINPKTAKSEGADFSSRLLKIATLID